MKFRLKKPPVWGAFYFISSLCGQASSPLNQELFEFCRKNQSDQVSQWMNEHPQSVSTLYEVDSLGYTPFHYSLMFDSLETQKILSPLIQDFENQSLSRGQRNQVDLVFDLVKEKPDEPKSLSRFLKVCLHLDKMNLRGQNQRRIFHMSLFYGKINVFKALLEKYQDQDLGRLEDVFAHADADGNTLWHSLAPFHDASLPSFFDSLHFDADFLKKSLRDQNQYGWTPLYVCTLYRNAPLGKWFLDHNSQVTLVRDLEGNTPLHAAMLMYVSQSPQTVEGIPSYIEHLIRETPYFTINKQGQTPYEILTYWWATGVVQDLMYDAMKSHFTRRWDKDKEQLKLNQNHKKALFFNHFKLLLDSYFENRRDELTGEKNIESPFLSFSNATVLLGEGLSFTGASVVASLASQWLKHQGDKIYLKDLNGTIKGLDGIARMHEEVEKLGFVLTHQYETVLETLDEPGILEFSEYAVRRIQKFITRNQYRKGQTFTDQIVDHFRHLNPIVQTPWRRLKVALLGEHYLKPASLQLTARRVLVENINDNSQK